MNMQLSVKKINTFSKQTPPVPNVVGNMFGSKSKVIFKNGLRSVDISKHNFINFASNKEPNYIKFIQKEINKLKQGTIDILKEYKEKWVGMTPNVKNRLNDVFYETYYYNIGLPYYLKKENLNFNFIINMTNQLILLKLFLLIYIIC